MTQPDPSPTPLPTFPLPLGPWLLWGPAAALAIGLLAAGIGFGASLYHPLSALLGGASAAIAALIAGLMVQPTRPREARQWMPWLMAAQMLSLATTAIAALVAWRAADAQIGPLGFTAAVAFMACQFAMTTAFADANRRATPRKSPPA